MALVLPVFLVSLFCSWFQCEMSGKPPFIRTSGENTKALINLVRGRSNTKLEDDLSYIDGPIANTTLGAVLGSKMRIDDQREIFAFTGVPYGEPPKRFRSPVMRKPWKGVWKATSPSPYCIQASGITMGMLRGSEDCLYLDIYTPRFPHGSNRSDLPVIMWIPAGANIYGRSVFYGPAYILREDVILVVVNMRVGILGYLTTGDEASPGNWGLKDISLSVKWVYENINAFGGDRTKIVIGGTSSGAYNAHAMLFTQHETRNYISGIYSMSGSALSNHGLDASGRVKNSSNTIAKAAGCPTTDEGKSWEMVECLRKMDAYILSAYQYTPYKALPPNAHMLGPVIEPDVPDAFVSELPETLYAKGKVLPIPLIITRTEDESSFTLQGMTSRYTMLPLLKLNWEHWVPKLLKMGLHSDNRMLPDSYEETQLSLMKITRFYFNNTSGPNALLRKDFVAFINMMDDSFYNAPMWKAVELHHTVGPTYSYLMKHHTYNLNPILARIHPLLFPTPFGASHATDFLLLFNNSNGLPPLSTVPEFETASRNLINMI